MSNAEDGGAENDAGQNTRPGTHEAGTNETGRSEATVPAEQTTEQTTEHSAQQTAENLSQEFAHESRLRILRSKAAVARSDVDAMAAMHFDPETMEDLLLNATPSEAARLRKSEHAITVRVAEARAKADAAEAEYEQAVLAEFDEFDEFDDDER
ncbi:MAG: hypothetical protein H7311_06020 [Ramlibacter sp.]|nr:hypothetical protein [Cryobacterium sp.]